MNSTQSQETPTTVVHELDATDRCDACGSQAYVRVRLQSGELFFCAHHADEVRETLSATALDWHDETDRLRDEHGA